MENITDQVKILAKYHSKVLNQMVVETLWAFVEDGDRNLYKIDNIPFYGPPFSADDIVHAEYDQDEESLTFQKVFARSGNSTIQIVILDDDLKTEDLRSDLAELGCPSEGTGTTYFVVEIPKDLNYGPIFDRLCRMEKAELIGFAEPCLSNQHHLQTKDTR